MTQSAQNGFKVSKLVRFEHCDPAGLIFYPRYFQLTHQVIEDWFRDGLGISHAQLVVEQKIGIPTVHVEADFLAASRLEDMLDYTLSVEKLGTSSVTLSIVAHWQDELRCRIKQVIVFAQLADEAIESVPIPPQLKTKMLPFQSAAPTP